jgi:hypothetical protein
VNKFYEKALYNPENNSVEDPPGVFSFVAPCQTPAGKPRTPSSFINSPYAVRLQTERALADCGMETQDEIFDLYVDFLASSVGLSTATGLAQVLDGDVSHDQITRMLARHPSCGADLWRWVKRTVRRFQRDDGVLLLDDTISHKPYTDENELVTWHYDHARNRSVKGIRFISALYHVQGVSVPVSFEVITKPRWETDPRSGKPRRRAGQTRGDIYRRMIKACLDNQIPFRYVINDTWYCSAENLNFIHVTLKKHFIMPLQSNRLVSVSEADKQAGRFVRLDCLSWEAGQVRRVWPRGQGFPVVVMRQVFENEDGSKGQLYLCSDDLELRAGQLCQIYKTRWKCEEYHKSLKQNAFLSGAPVQRRNSHLTHLLASLCAFVRLEMLKKKKALNHFALKAKLYLYANKLSFAAFERMRGIPLPA